MNFEDRVLSTLRLLAEHQVLLKEYEKFFGMGKRKRTDQELKAADGLPKIAKDIQKQQELDSPDTRYFLVKAEPETRIVKGVDVKFSLDDLKVFPI